MNIQFYPAELDYVNVKARRAGSFLSAFLMACISADAENYELLRPVLLTLMQKYPADPDEIAAEREKRITPRAGGVR